MTPHSAWLGRAAGLARAVAVVPNGASTLCVAGIALAGGCAAPTEDVALPDTPAACVGDARRMEPWPGGADWDAQHAGSPESPTGWGVVVADLDGDGQMEIFLPQPGQDELFRVTSDGAVVAIGEELREGRPRVPFEAVTGRGAVAADYDGDGALDLYVTNHGPDVLLHNDGAGWFEDVTAAAGLGTEEAASTSAAWADMDGDGDLDLAVAHTAVGDDPVTREVISGANALWENGGDGTFRDVSGRLVGDAVGQVAFVLGWVEADGDGAPDLYAANDKGHQGHANALLQNDGAGGFVDVSAASGTGMSMQGMGLAEGDLDGDGRADLLVSDWGRVWLFASEPGGGWYDATYARGMTLDLAAGSVVGWGPAWVDLDLDGDLDAFVAFGPDDTSTGLSQGDNGLEGGPEEPDVFFVQGDDGAFADEAAAWGLADTGVGRGFTFADLDGDGALDLVRRDLWGRASILRNTCPGDAAVTVSLDGEAPNRFGVGARVRVTADDGWSATRWIRAGGGSIASGGPPVAAFGVGARATVRVEVTWPDGVESVVEGVRAGAAVRVGRP